MRLTTLLDTDRTGSGAWPTTAIPTTAARPTTIDENRRFDQLVADFIPCRSNDPELWFAEQTTQVEQAKAMCRECPLVEGCLAGALERAEPWGVWGGEVFVGGAVVATKRGRGRPRKNAVA